MIEQTFSVEDDSSHYVLQHKSNPSWILLLVFYQSNFLLNLKDFLNFQFSLIHFSLFILSQAYLNSINKAKLLIFSKYFYKKNIWSTTDKPFLNSAWDLFISFSVLPINFIRLFYKLRLKIISVFHFISFFWIYEVIFLGRFLWPNFFHKLFYLYIFIATIIIII